MPKDVDQDKLNAEIEDIHAEIRSAYEKVAHKFYKNMETARHKANNRRNALKRAVQLRRFELYGNAIQEIDELAARYATQVGGT